MAELLRRKQTGTRSSSRSSQGRAVRWLGASDEEARLLDEFPAAVISGQLTLDYQPEMSLLERRWVGAEALVRWHHPELGLLSPVRFVPALERHGLSGTLGHWVLDEAVSQMARWETELGERAPQFVSVNVAAVDLGDPGLVDQVIAAVDAAGIAPGQLLLEVTETSLMAQPLESLAALDLLKAYGVKLAIDDFGAGYSALAYLFQLPSDTVKLDRVFLAAHDSTAQRLVITSLVDLAHKLGLRVVAEGVETDAHLEAVTEFGCDLAQGYGLCRPTSAERVAELFASPTRLSLTH